MLALSSPTLDVLPSWLASQTCRLLLCVGAAARQNLVGVFESFLGATRASRDCSSDQCTTRRRCQPVNNLTNAEDIRENPRVCVNGSGNTG